MHANTHLLFLFGLESKKLGWWDRATRRRGAKRKQKGEMHAFRELTRFHFGPVLTPRRRDGGFPVGKARRLWTRKNRKQVKQKTQDENRALPGHLFSAMLSISRCRSLFCLVSMPCPIQIVRVCRGTGLTHILLIGGIPQKDQVRDARCR